MARKLIRKAARKALRGRPKRVSSGRNFVAEARAQGKGHQGVEVQGGVRQTAAKKPSQDARNSDGDKPHLRRCRRNRSGAGIRGNFCDIECKEKEKGKKIIRGNESPVKP